MATTPDEEYKKFFRVRILKKIYIEKYSKSKTRGKDNKDSASFGTNLDSHINHISKQTLSGKYKFIPYLELLKNKGKGKHPRAIAIPSLRDRIVLFQLKNYISLKMNEESKQDLANTIVNGLVNFYKTNGDLSNKEIIKIDIKAFYDEIDHDILLGKLRTKIKSKKALSLIESAITNPNIPMHIKAGDKNSIGVHQGLSTSNILASIYLHELDTIYKNMTGIAFFRFVDDVLIFCETGRGNSLFHEISTYLSDQLKLQAHPLDRGKSVVQSALQKFDYLGYSICNGNVSVRKSSVQRFIDEVAKLVTKFKYKIQSSTQLELEKEVLIEELNEKISGAYSEGRKYGWVAFFVQITDATLLGRMDYSISKIFCSIPELAPHKERVKTLRRSIYEMRYRPENGYVFNYETIISTDQKISYLSKRGKINLESERTYSKKDIDILYEKTKYVYLSRLEIDEALRS